MKTTAEVKARKRARSIRPRLLVAAVFLALALSPLLSPAAVRADDEWESSWPPAQSSDQVKALVTSRLDSNTIYAATTEGVYRGSDGGGSWSLRSTLAGVTSLVVDPASADIVHATCWPRSQDANAPRGIRTSVDGGRTWSDPTGGAGANAIGSPVVIVVDPVDPNVLLIGTAYDVGPGRILRSTDRGATWNTVYTIDSPMGLGSITGLAFSPAAHNIVYATHDVYHGGVILRSDDAGRTWQTLTAPTAPLSYPAALALHPYDPSIAYVAYVAPMGAGVRTFMTFNGGGAGPSTKNLPAWTSISEGLPETGSSGPRLAISEVDPSIVFLSLRGDNPGLYVFGMNTQRWTRFSPSTAPFDDINSLDYSPDSRRIFCATGHGIWQRLVAANLAPQFADYYSSHDGWRVLGRAISPLLNSSGLPAQYFEKGRLEDHSMFVVEENWKFMFGLLVDQLQAAKVTLPIGGEVSSVNYSTINSLAGQDRRTPSPAGFTGGVWPNADGSVFIPYSAQLQPTAGHTVPAVFWNYINRTDLFPGGWLHDIGLPMTEPILATVDKGEVRGRQIWIQAFQRTVLTYDQLNPPNWQVERANVGTDYDRALR